MDSPFDDLEVTKIASLKRTKTIERLSRDLAEQQSQKKAEMARRGLLQSGAFIKVMHDLNVKRVEGIVYAHYNAWKEALSETGYPLTSEHLRRIATEAGRRLENAPGNLTESLKHQCHGLNEIIDKMSAGIEQDVHSVKVRFVHDSEIEIAKAKIAERTPPNRDKSPMADRLNPAPDFSFIHDADLRRIVERDYSELQMLDPDIDAKSVLIMSGTIIEGLLLDAIVAASFVTKEKAAEMTLQQLLAAATKAAIIREDRLGNAVRNYRNLIHPAREIRDKLIFSKADARLARAAVDVIIQEIRKHFDSPPITVDLNSDVIADYVWKSDDALVQGTTDPLRP
jgi:hypothetical protein